METYEACVTAGLRDSIVKREVGPAVEKLAIDAYGEKPDVDSDSDVNDPSNPTQKSGGVGFKHDIGIDTEGGRNNREAMTNISENDEDWSKAFGDDPSQLLRQKEGVKSGGNQARLDTDDEDEDDSSDDEEESTGIIGKIKDYKKNEKDLHRKHRGAMQWKPVRTMKAMKDQMKVGVVKAKTRLSMTGREPDVEVLFPLQRR
jgi:hypothetical protein